MTPSGELRGVYSKYLEKTQNSQKIPHDKIASNGDPCFRNHGKKFVFYVLKKTNQGSSDQLLGSIEIVLVHC